MNAIGSIYGKAVKSVWIWAVLGLVVGAILAVVVAPTMPTFAEAPNIRLASLLLLLGTTLVVTATNLLLDLDNTGQYKCWYLIYVGFFGWGAMLGFIITFGWW